MTPLTIQYIIDSFISSSSHVALYIEHVDISNTIETLLIYKKDLVFIEVIETEGNEKEDYINNYLLKVELQSDTVIFIQPANVSSMQQLTKEQYNRVVKNILSKEVASDNPENTDSVSPPEEDNGIELDIDLSETEKEDFPYNPDEAITYITTDIAKLSAHLSTPQVDQINNSSNNTYNNKMYNILKKLSKLFKPIQYNNNNNNNQPINNNNNNNNYTAKGIQKQTTYQKQYTQNKQPIQYNNNNNNTTVDNIQNTEQQQPIQYNKEKQKQYSILSNKIKLLKQLTNNTVDSISKDILQVINNVDNTNKNDIKQQLSNIINKYNNNK